MKFKIMVAIACIIEVIIVKSINDNRCDTFFVLTHFCSMFSCCVRNVKFCMMQADKSIVV